MPVKRKQNVINLGRKRRRKWTMDKQHKTYAIIVGIIIVLACLLIPNAYKITINGEFIGAVKHKKIIEGAKRTVLTQLENEYHVPVKFAEEVETKLYHAKRQDYIDQNYLISQMRTKLDILIGVKEVLVEGESLGMIANEEILEQLKQQLKERYYGDRNVAVDFDKQVELKEVYAKESDLMTLAELVQKCIATTPRYITYTVKSGDSLSAIASRYNTTVESIINANPGLTKNTALRVGQEIKAHVNDPFLPIRVVSFAAVRPEE